MNNTGKLVRYNFKLEADRSASTFLLACLISPQRKKISNANFKMVMRATFTRTYPMVGLPRCGIGLMPRTYRQMSTTQKTQTPEQNPKIMLEDPNGYGFIRHNPRPPKPRKTGVTEIRGPYYSAMGKRHLQDVFETCV